MGVGPGNFLIFDLNFISMARKWRMGAHDRPRILAQVLASITEGIARHRGEKARRWRRRTPSLS